MTLDVDEYGSIMHDVETLYRSIDNLQKEWDDWLYWEMRPVIAKAYALLGSSEPCSDATKLVQKCKKFDEAVTILKGQLLIYEKQSFEKLRHVPRLESFSEKTDEGVNNDPGSEAKTLQSGTPPTIADITHDQQGPQKEKKKDKKKAAAEDLPDGIYPTSADMAKGEKEFC